MEQLMAMNPQLGGMDPQMRELFRSERFRQMMFVGPALRPDCLTRLTPLLLGRTQSGFE